MFCYQFSESRSNGMPQTITILYFIIRRIAWVLKNV